MILPIYLYDKDLLVKSEPVTEFNDELRKLVEDMIETVIIKDGAALAAIQCHIPQRVFVVNPVIDKQTQQSMTFINPYIIEQDGTQRGKEGCLSFPHLQGIVVRPNEVYIGYQDVDGISRRIIATDLLARIVCHETDHLDGIVLTTRMSSMERTLFMKKFHKYEKTTERFLAQNAQAAARG